MFESNSDRLAGIYVQPFVRAHNKAFLAAEIMGRAFEKNEPRGPPSNKYHRSIHFVI